MRGVSARGGRVVQPSDPPTNRPQRLPSQCYGQGCALVGRQRHVQAGVIRIDQVDEHANGFVGYVSWREVRESEIQGEGQVVDAWPHPHDIEVSYQRRPTLTEADVVVPEVAVHKLSGQTGDEFRLEVRQAFGKLFREFGYGQLFESWIPGSDPPDALPSASENFECIDVVSKRWLASGRANIDRLQQRMDVTE